MDDPHDVSDAMLRVMQTVDPSLELKQVLYRLVELSVEITGAERSAILTVEDGKLVPTAVAARRPNRELFRRFRAMKPIDLEAVSGRRGVIEGGTVVTIEDARDNPLVPQDWVEILGTASVAVVPLVIGDEPRGLLAVDYVERHEFTPSELNLLKAVAEATRIAVGNSDLYQQSVRLREAERKLTEAMTTIGSAFELSDALEAVAALVASLFSGSRCLITFDEGRRSVASGPDRDGGRETVFPLRVGGRLLGHLTLATDKSIAMNDLQMVEAFGHQAALALDRAVLAAGLEEQRAVAEAIAAMPRHAQNLKSLDAASLRRLDQALFDGAGIRCVEVALRRRAQAEALGCRVLRPDEHALSARLSLEPGPAVEPVEPPGGYAVSLTSGRALVGLLYVEADGSLGLENMRLLRALAASIGDVVQRTKLGEDLQRATQRAARADELTSLEDELERKMDRTLGLLASGLREVLGSYQHDPDVAAELRQMHSLVSGALMDAHGVAASQAALELTPDSLEVGLRSLIRSFEREAGITADLRVTGSRRELPEGVEEAVYAIAFEALTALERSGRASGVVMTLTYGEPLTLAVRDDGVGLSQREGEAAPGVHYALAAIKQRAEKLGGRISLAYAEPRGMRLEALLPLAGHVPAQRPQVANPVREERLSANEGDGA